MKHIALIAALALAAPAFATHHEGKAHDEKAEKGMKHDKKAMKAMKKAPEAPTAPAADAKAAAPTEAPKK